MKKMSTIITAVAVAGTVALVAIAPGIVRLPGFLMFKATWEMSVPSQPAISYIGLNRREVIERYSNFCKERNGDKAVTLFSEEDLGKIRYLNDEKYIPMNATDAELTAFLQDEIFTRDKLGLHFRYRTTEKGSWAFLKLSFDQNGIVVKEEWIIFATRQNCENEF